MSSTSNFDMNAVIKWPSFSENGLMVYGTLVLRRFQFAEASASRTAVRSSSSSKGLVRNADAPAFNAVERTSGSSFPVKMMTRVEGEISRSWD